MRIALLADIHGNPLALDAVLLHIEARGGVDGYWVLGDHCANGFDPSGVVERLIALPNLVAIRGNADRYIATGERPSPTVAEAAVNPALIATLSEVAGSFGWTHGHLTARGLLDWVSALPLDHRETLPDGTRVLLVHASPGEDGGSGLHPVLTDEAVRARIEGSEADLICVGHFHSAMDRRVDGVRLINPGPVSNPFPPDLRPSYAILHADVDSHWITFHRTEYDVEAAVEATLRSGTPGMKFITRFLRGEVRAFWFPRWNQQTYFPTPADD